MLEHLAELLQVYHVGGGPASSHDGKRLFLETISVNSVYEPARNLYTLT